MQPIIPIIRKEAFDDPAYLFELKLDGFRGIADTIQGRMLSKNGNRLTRFEPLIKRPNPDDDDDRPCKGNHVRTYHPKGEYDERRGEDGPNGSARPDVWRGRMALTWAAYVLNFLALRSQLEEQKIALPCPAKPDCIEGRSLSRP